MVITSEPSDIPVFTTMAGWGGGPLRLITDGDLGSAAFLGRTALDIQQDPW